MDRALRNLAAAHPLARLTAIHEVGRLLRDRLDHAIDLVELEHVRAARSAGESWGSILGGPQF